jgi:hypothetical protein
MNARRVLMVLVFLQVLALAAIAEKSPLECTDPTIGTTIADGSFILLSHAVWYGQACPCTDAH